MPKTRGPLMGRGCRIVAAFALVVAATLPALAQAPGLLPPAQQAPAPPAAGPGVPGPTLITPNGGPPPAAAPPSAQANPPVGQVALAVVARYGREPAAINAGLLWRVYSDRPGQNGQLRLIKEDRTASPTFMLPPGGYVVHVTFGLTQAMKRVQLRAETVREVFEIAAGGVRFEGRVGDARIPVGQIFFDIVKGSQFEPGDKRPIIEQAGSGDVVLLPEGTYHVVSNYGDGNSVMRSDFRVTLAKLIDMTIVHRAARITLKLVSQPSGEALANTQWSISTPSGDLIKETSGAFPTVILAEGDYVVVAKNNNRVYPGKFKVESGLDREVEVLAR